MDADLSTTTPFPDDADMRVTSQSAQCFSIATPTESSFSDASGIRACPTSEFAMRTERGQVAADSETSHEVPPWRTSRSHSPRACWPLSQNEKKDIVINFYDREAKESRRQLEDVIGERSNDIQHEYRAAQSSVDALRGDVQPQQVPAADDECTEVNTLRNEVESLKAVMRQLITSGSLPSGINKSEEDDACSRPRSGSLGAAPGHVSVAAKTIIRQESMPLAEMSDHEDNIPLRAKSEGAAPLGALRNDATGRRRRRSRPEAPLQVRFADDVHQNDRSPSSVKVSSSANRRNQGSGRKEERNSVRRGRELRRRNEYNVQLLPRGVSVDVCDSKDTSLPPFMESMQQSLLSYASNRSYAPSDEPHPEPGSPQAAAAWGMYGFGRLFGNSA